MPCCRRSSPGATSPTPRCTSRRFAYSIARPPKPGGLRPQRRTCAPPPRWACARSSSAGPSSGGPGFRPRIRLRSTTCSTPMGSTTSPRPWAADRRLAGLAQGRRRPRKTDAGTRLATVPSEDLPVAEFAFPGPLRDQLVAAIVAGSKTTTTGLIADYENDNKPLPRPGLRQVVVDSAGNPVAGIETTAGRGKLPGQGEPAHRLGRGQGA